MHRNNIHSVLIMYYACKLTALFFYQVTKYIGIDGKNKSLIP